MSTSASLVRHCMTFRVDGQLCGLPIACVREVLDDVEISRVPLAPPSIAGHLNLRGRIVTAIDLGALLAQPQAAVHEAPSNDNGPLGSGRDAIVLEHGATLYALLNDQTGDVIRIEEGELITASSDRPDDRWAALALGVIMRPDDLIVLLDHVRLISALGDNLQ